MQFRSIDGSANNPTDSGLNAAGASFDRTGPARYADGIHAMVDGPNARTISNLVSGEGDAAVPNTQGLSGMMYAWGQFIDHDLTRTQTGGANISVVVPAGDAEFAEGTAILVTRAAVAAGTGVTTPASAVNRATAWLDGSVVYGSDATTAAALRGANGKMLVSAGDNLPIVDGQFLAGDPRAQENPSLTSLQTIFVREHNLQVDRLAAADPSLDAEALYQQARAIVSAEIAHITYAEFLPHLLGPGAIPEYRGYDPTVDASLTLEFAAAAYRWGHSTVSAETVRRDETGAEDGEALELRDAFFLSAGAFIQHGGAGGFLRHLGTDRSQAMDGRIVEDLRSFLFDAGVGSDLAAINIQRGRDLGLGTLNQTRIALGLPAYTSFAALTSDAATAAGLEAAYGSIDAVELWTGGLSENLVPGAFLGETFQAIVAEQFRVLRDGDRFYYENQGFDAATLAMIEGSTLSSIILRTTDTQYYQADAFVAVERRAADAPSELPELAQLVIGTGTGETLNGGALGDILAGRAGDQLLQSFGGADTQYGGEGQDTLLGGAGEDVLWGEEGDDLAYGGIGHDLIRGGQGQDRLHGDQGDDTIGGGAEDDTLWGDAGADVLFGEAGADVFFGEDGNDTVYGGEGADTAYGGAGADALAGQAGDDALAGGDDDDALYGGEGRDSLFGQAGRDTLEGGAGADWLLGGEGADLFRFRADAADGSVDWIGDFSRAEGDRIDLSSFGGFHLAETHQGTLEVVLQFDPGSGKSLVRAYVTAAEEPVLVFGVSGTGPLSAGDFLF